MFSRRSIVPLLLSLSVVVLAARAQTANQGQVENLGPQVFTANTHTVSFGREGNADRVYVVRDGATDGGATPGSLLVVDPNTAEILHDVSLPGSEGSWATTMASDQTVYIGVYVTGRLFRYIPGTDHVTDLGQVPGQSFLYYLSAGKDGTIYGGTFPGAALFSYNPDRGFDIWPADIARIGANYVRGTAYDPENHVVYGGLATPARLIRRDLTTGESSDITPPSFANEAFILGIRVVGSKVFCRLADQTKCVVLDVSKDGKTITEDAAFDMISVYVSPPDEAGYVYYTNHGAIYRYDPASKQTQATGRQWPANGHNLGVLRLNDQTNFPGLTLVGVGNRDGKIWLGKYNIQTGHTTADFLATPGVKLTIESIVNGPDGKIYSSGYLTGGTGVYDPAQPAAKSPTLSGVIQSEGITTLDGKIYYGGYPSALLYEHDPFQPWQPGVNPKPLFDLAEQHQDRPFGMSSGGGLVIMGTAPNYGHLGGALCLYDPKSGQRTIRTADELGISDLSLNATYYHEGNIYGGTSISGGLGSHATKSRALLLRYNVAADRGEGIPLPDSIPNQTAITAVCAGPDGMIWLMCEGWLLVYDPASGKFIHQANIFPGIRYQPTSSRVLLRDARLVLAKDGRIYGTIGNRYLFRIQPKDYAVETLLVRPEGCGGLVYDGERHFYFISKTDLVRFTP